jgi:hypothetical protein
VNIIIPLLLAWWLAGALYRRVHPSVADRAPTRSAFGAISLKLDLPGTSGGIPEPLIVCGVPGRAALVYIRFLNRQRARVGVEFWGLGAFEGEAFAVPTDHSPVSLTCALPALFPPVGDRRWGHAAPGLAQLRRGEYLITVNGTVRLEGAVTYEQPEHSRLYFGANPVGGSLVTNRFTGTILDVSQSF